MKKCEPLLVMLPIILFTGLFFFFQAFRINWKDKETCGKVFPKCITLEEK